MNEMQDTAATAKRPWFKRKRIWLIIAATATVLSAAMWLLALRFAPSAPRSSFDGARLFVEATHTIMGPRELKVEAGAFTDVGSNVGPVRFTVEAIHLDTMTITLGFDKELLLGGVGVTQVEVPHDSETITLISPKATDGVYGKYQIELLMPSCRSHFSSDGLALSSETTYVGDQMTLRLSEGAFAASFGQWGSDLIYGTYEETDERLVLTTDAHLAEYTFIKGENGSLCHDASQAYYHPVSTAFRLPQDFVLEHRYHFEKASDTRMSFRVMDHDGRAVMEATADERPYLELQDDSTLCVRYRRYVKEGFEWTYRYIDLDTMTLFPTYNTVYADCDVRLEGSIDAYLHYDNQIPYLKVDRYETKMDCGTGVIEPDGSKYYEFEYKTALPKADIRASVQGETVFLAYTDGDGERHTDVYELNSRKMLADAVHTIGGSFVGDAEAKREAIFSADGRTVYYCGITAAYYLRGGYRDLREQLNSGALTIAALEEQLAHTSTATAESYRDGVQYRFEENDASQAVLIDADGNIYVGDLTGL